MCLKLFLNDSYAARLSGFFEKSENTYAYHRKKNVEKSFNIFYL